MTEASETRVPGLGIRFKLYTLFCLLIAVITGLAYYLTWQLTSIADQFGKQGTTIIKELAEKDIASTAQSVASQVRLYLDAHPELKKEQFMANAAFKSLAIQPVGKTGYTVLYSYDEDGKWRLWVHPNPNVTAPKLDDLEKLKGPFGENFPEFWKLITRVKTEQSPKGYYRWQEKDKSFRTKFMACANVPGTTMYIASTTYIDEFVEPITRLERQSQSVAQRETNRIAATFAITIAVVSVITFLFGQALVRNIRYLSEMADRISLGDLDVQIEVRSRDELAVLTESISRLQQSLKMSMQRLRKAA
ncbi:MAG: hypothetical protein A2045_05995 [Rhodocyclales bacterium GWA2_65_20]|nr:MAG: hypothetical protein A2045_05995 [Rhodocyclales bacterium GWA2_65_20]